MFCHIINNVNFLKRDVFQHLIIFIIIGGENMTIKPIGTRVLIQPLKEGKEKKTEGGVYISEEKDNNLNIGKIIETGKNVKNIDKGDKVIYKDFDSAEYDGYIIIKEDNIIAKL